MGYGEVVRIHVYLDDALLERLDERVSTRGRSRFIEQALRAALDQEERWELIRSAFGSVPDEGHDWDQDPAAWVAKQRHADERRVG